MIIRIYGTNYKINNDLAISAKTTIRKILEDVKAQSDLKGFSRYYTAFVVMMYVVSSSILKGLNKESIDQIIEEIKKEEKKAENSEVGKENI